MSHIPLYVTIRMTFSVSRSSVMVLFILHNFVEFEDGSILSTKNRESYVPVKPTDEYFRLEETPANLLWDESFPLLKVGAWENAENNNVGQVFDTSTQRATHTFQETEPKPTGKGEKKGVEVSEEQVNQIREELSCATKKESENKLKWWEYVFQKRLLFEA
ncbi:uncharacterized protein LOC129901710 isoform X2 [Solanum dulcamara]|uniref:uncharacterized protein LOC129901710 isoform X2 n=1 Tax=Solanum dulcamara TaxID=45834 RepID=UPI0024864FF8|nr:uncharacterized protein LOC129901710 isoform X2 [Solanum dulcamara]